MEGDGKSGRRAYRFRNPLTRLPRLLSRLRNVQIPATPSHCNIPPPQHPRIAARRAAMDALHCDVALLPSFLRAVADVCFCCCCCTSAARAAAAIREAGACGLALAPLYRKIRTTACAIWPAPPLRSPNSPRLGNQHAIIFAAFG